MKRQTPAQVSTRQQISKKTRPAIQPSNANSRSRKRKPDPNRPRTRRDRRQSSSSDQEALARRLRNPLFRTTRQLTSVLGRGLGIATRQRLAGQPVWLVSIAASLFGFLAGHGVGLVLGGAPRSPNASASTISYAGNQQTGIHRPTLSPQPAAPETWNCEVVVIGGSLGGVAAASHAMQSGATTCLIELTPWLGGQISSQGVSALDESQVMRSEESISKSWSDFKRLIAQQPVNLPAWTNVPPGQRVEEINSCWVGMLCFPPHAGDTAAGQLLKSSQAKAPSSRWSTSTAFKGAEFDASGRKITAVYAVRRTPRQPNYAPKGRFSAELSSWYSWSSNDEFEKTPLRLQPPPGKQLMVIDATDSTELVGWAGIPHRLGSESLATTGERNASKQDNADCTQAFTYPFVLAVRDDQGESLKTLEQLESDYSKEEHRSDYDLQGYPMFSGRSFFNYRRIVSLAPGDPYQATPVPGDMTAVNWNRGNDWKFMDPPLLLTDEQLDTSGQRQNWLGGVSVVALRHAENHAFLFAHWLLEHHAKQLPLTYLSGAESPMGTTSGLSMVPYLREGRRIVGRKAYDQREFAVREADLRSDMEGGRDFSPTAIARIHYSIDIHGCRYRNWEDDGEAASASVGESSVRPTLIPLEALIPHGVDNLLIGGKGIAVTHIANGMTRIHQSEWSIGAVAGATAGWLATHYQSKLSPAEIIPKRQISHLRHHLSVHGLGMN